MKIIAFLLNLLVFLIPLIFFPKTSELFEFNKAVTVYILTILIAAAWLWQMAVSKKIIFKHTPLDIPIIIFLSSQLAATIFSIDPKTSLLGYYGRFNGGLISYICYAILYFAFVTFMDKRATLKLINTLLISTIIAGFYALFEHFGRSPSCLLITGSFDVSCWVQRVDERVFGTFGQPNWLAAYLASLTPLMWSQALNTKKTILFAVLSMLMFVALLFTKSRSGLLGFGIAFIAFWSLAFYFSKKFKAILKIFSVVAIFILFGIIFIWNPLKQSTEPSAPGVTESGDIRKIVWQGALELWKKYPLLGTGVETFAYSYYETRPAAHNLTSEWNYLYNKAHNEYLNFAATTGTVGLASYILLILSTLFTFYKSKKSILNFAFLSGYISILVTNFFGFSTVPTALLFFLFPAFTISLGAPPIKQMKIKHKSSIFLLLILLAGCFLLFSTAKYWLADYFYAGQEPAKAVTLSPREPLFRLELAKNYTSSGNITRAGEQLKLAEKMSPRNIKLMKSIASAYGEAGEIDKKYYYEENRILNNIANFAPTDASLFYSLAISYGRLGNVPEAKKSLQIALLLKPDYELAKNLLDRLR